MSATTHAIAAYAVTILLLWGYATTLWLSSRRQKTIHSQDKRNEYPQGSPGAIREGSDLP